VKELDPDEIKDRLTRVSGQEQGAGQEVIEGQGVPEVRGGFSAVLARETAAARGRLAEEDGQ
jgi:hypothetical protein